MKKFIAYILGLFVFWFLLFASARIFFLAYQIPLANKYSNFSDLVRCFYEGWQLDLASSVIMIYLSFLFGLTSVAFQIKSLKTAAKYWLLFSLLLYLMIALGDAGLYREWNSKLNMQALSHAKHPTEIISIVSNRMIAIFFISLTLFSVPFYFLYKRLIHPNLTTSISGSLKIRSIIWLLFFVSCTTLGVFAIRGGITNLPINQSVAYFSKDQLPNSIAVNPLYNLLQDMIAENSMPDPSKYKAMSDQEAEQVIKNDFVSEPDSCIKILNTTRPNLVFIFLESWNADNIESLGGISSCTPNFDALTKEGILCTHAYSHAYVSDQGIPAVLSAYPSPTNISVINKPDKLGNLPCLSEDMNKLHYRTQFLYGGDLIFGDFKSYFRAKKIDDIVDIESLPQYKKGRLGVQDEDIFPELLSRLNKTKQPFFQGVFTLSTHTPFDFTSSDTWHSPLDGPENRYAESMHYADIHLGKFFEAAKKQSWYTNTLFILVADHSHNSNIQREPADINRHHIPLLFVGGCLKKEWQGVRWDSIVSQLDIASTVLHQMDLPTESYPWSRNIFNPSKPSSAYYLFFGGEGYVNEKGYFAINHYHQELSNMSDSSAKNSMKVKALGFQQLIYNNLMNRK